MFHRVFFRLPTTPVQFQNLETLIACSGVDWKTLLSVEKHADVKAFPSVKTLVVELEREVDLHGGNAIFDHLQVLQTLQVTGMAPHWFVPAMSS